ncbi:MAG: hypothetical protein WBF71_11030 [Microthrixaceae bacterium]
MNQPPTDDDDAPDGAADTDSDFDPDLSLADLRSSQAAGRLRRENREIQRRREQTTIRSLLHGSIGETVVAHTAGATTHSGTVVEVGVDYAAIESDAGLCWVALSSVGAVELETEKVLDSDFEEIPDSMLIDVIEDLIAAEAILSVSVTNGAVLVGEATSVGASLFLRNRIRRGSSVVNFEMISAVEIKRP